MNKLLAIIRREYLQRVRSKFFVIMTVLGPFMLVVFTVVPGMLLNIKTGETRLAIIDQTEGTKVYESVRAALLTPARDDEAEDNADGVAESAGESPKERMEKQGKSLTGTFSVEQVQLGGRSLDDVRLELNARIGRDELDGYLVIPPD